jgi:OOP family OmpA-OmpF porin
MHFDFDKMTQTGSADDSKKEYLGSELKPKVQVRIAGYTSTSGTDAYTQNLSERRANAVKG